MASKVVASFLALSSLLSPHTAAHPTALVRRSSPTQPEAVPAPLHPGGHSDHGALPDQRPEAEICANVLKGLVDVKIGYGPDDCCSLLSGIADLDAAICLCTAVKANVLGIRVNLPVDLGLILNKCGKTYPTDFTC
ncbi:hypothetical protein OsJ_31187 [Oryza sativa Japonica Group]|uniref:Bifunctional inhibitor/plant lipid transfer protein/seed storage helical domain-containing protein n=1 Tax=Oryza sativa subsp. japonica TaxID=39947 RepID=A3C3V6_ORYSJ|nr:hypothetical protein OsJ_31187 [Oryza sativa Japonica Group]